MRVFAGAVAASALLFTSACTPILKEVRHTGGYPGYLLDNRTFDASASKQLVLLRATIILAMAADMGQFTVTGADADSFASLLAAGAEEINYAAADLYAGDGNCPGKIATSTDAGCVGFYANFESNLPRIEARIVKIMLAALPTDKARKFLQDVSKGNVMGAAWNALGAVAQSAGGLHFAFARYRSGLETAAESLPGCPDVASKFDPAKMTVVAAAKCLGLSETRLFQKADGTTSARLGKAVVSKQAFFMLLRGVAADCVNLPYAGTGSALATSQTARAKACNAIGFEPRARPFRIIGTEHQAPTDKASAPFKEEQKKSGAS